MFMLLYHEKIYKFYDIFFNFYDENTLIFFCFDVRFFNERTFRYFSDIFGLRSFLGFFELI